VIDTDELKVAKEEQAAFDLAYIQAAAQVASEAAKQMFNGHPVGWMPLRGRKRDEAGELLGLDDLWPFDDPDPSHWSSQKLFLFTDIQEGLYHGTRGPGKTDTLLMDFASGVGRGYGKAWRGILFRQTYPQLADVVAKSERWFRQIFPGAKFNKSKLQWEWPTGEVLLFRHMNSPSDYWNYHGHEYPWIGWEELTNWATDECYKSMFSCNRCSVPGVPRRIRATTNPYGVGHNWVKVRFALDGKWWQPVFIESPVDQDGNAEPPRFAIHGHIDENYILLKSDPTYKTTVVASAASPEMIKAWLHGSWAIVAGGMFGDVWRPATHIVRPFTIPSSWRIDRSFDWGSAKPFSVGWWAESDGSDYMDADGKWRSSVRGDLYRIAEWYGFTGKANEGVKMLASEIAQGIKQREYDWGLINKVHEGPADSSIFDSENGNCIADDMEEPVRLKDGKQYRGVTWTRAFKRPGSRKTGWEKMRRMFKDAIPEEGKPRERPGLFVFDTCKQFTRTVPVLPRDEKNMDDVDTDAEDHIGDETRYRVHESGTELRQGKTIGTHA
jgi:hypothetical protein